MECWHLQISQRKATILYFQCFSVLDLLPLAGNLEICKEKTRRIYKIVESKVKCLSNRIARIKSEFQFQNIIAIQWINVTKTFSLATWMIVDKTILILEWFQFSDRHMWNVMPYLTRRLWSHDRRGHPFHWDLCALEANMFPCSAKKLKFSLVEKINRPGTV